MDNQHDPQLAQIHFGSYPSELTRNQRNQPRLERSEQRSQILTDHRFAPITAEVLRSKIIGLQDHVEQMQTLTMAVEILEESLKRNNPQEIDAVVLAFKPLMGSMLSIAYLNPNIQCEGKRRLDSILDRLHSVFDVETMEEIKAVLTRLDAPERTAPVCYKYDLQTKRGFMRVGSSLVPILVIENYEPSVHNCFQVTHVNQINYKFWDQNTNSLICECPDLTLGQYLGDSPPIQMVRGRFIYLVPMVRKVFREILTYIVDMHERGFMLDRFTKGDLHLIDGTIKFVGVGLKNHDGNRRQLAVNFRDLADLVEGLFCGQRRPLELTDFLARIKVDFISRRQELGLQYHICLMPPSALLRFFINVGSILIEGHMKQKLNAALRVLGDCTNWDQNINGVGYLVLRDFFHGLHMTQKNKIKAVYDTNAKDNVSRDDVKRSMLKFFRNLAVHLRSFSQVAGTETTLELQVLILHPFAKELCCMQKNLCDFESPEMWFE